MPKEHRVAQGLVPVVVLGQIICHHTIINLAARAVAETAVIGVPVAERPQVRAVITRPIRQ
jgi:hypothetical protein